MPTTRRILVIDDEPPIARLLAVLLGDGARIEAAYTATDGLARLEDTPYDMVLVDLQLPEMDGVEVVRRARRRDPDTPFVIFTAQATIETAVAAMREGAFDYLRKTAGVEELRATIERAAEHGSLAREVRRLRSEVDRARGTHEVIGTSSVTREMLGLAERVAGSDASVLLLGESGTGKELLARTIHRHSPRRDAPFVAFDCSALAPSLLESELFGHEKGAFTGAGRARRGLFREATGGTLFLDEIGDIAPEVQNKLLRVLQEREIKPVGGDVFVKIDVRIVAATNKDLKALVKRGAFREDLYWRLAVVPIRVPPLRERREDLPLLCAHFLARRRGGAGQAGDETRRWPTRLSAGAIAKLAAYPWPGNVRELENVLYRAAILCEGDEIRAEDVPLELAGGSGPVELHEGGVADGRPLPAIVEDAIRAVEKQAIKDALTREEGSPTRAAKRLGISRASIYSKIKQYGIVV